MAIPVGTATIASDSDETTKNITSLDNVPVSTFSWCSCGYPGYAEEHVQVRTFEVQLETGAAVATSYGIGDFDRCLQTFGHREGNASSPVQLMVGGEWSAQSLARTFVILSAQHGALWFDQLSIPQDPKLIPIHLQNMPKIYRTFEVIILQPNAPCPCLLEAVETYDAGGERATRYSDKEGEFDLRRRLDACVNAIPMSSYYYRLWTMQEFVHARTISVHYCALPSVACSRDTSISWNVQTRTISTLHHPFMGKWLTWLYESYCGQTADQQEWQGEAAWSLMEQHISAGFSNIMMSVWAFISRKDIDYMEANLHRHEYLIARFILGERLTRVKNEGEQILLYTETDGYHVASVAQDFILAVFPTSRSYQMPPNAANLSVPALLDDALAQDETGRAAFTMTRLPRGLFILGEPNSMRCQPSMFLPAAEHIKTMRDVYGSFTSSTFRTITRLGHVMLSLRSPAPTAARSRIVSSKTFSSAFPADDPQSTDNALRFLRKVSSPTHHHFGSSHNREPLSSWAHAVVRNDIVYSRAKGDSWPSPEHEKAVMSAMLHGAPQRDGWGDLPLVDNETVAYSLMCDFLPIKVGVARNKSLGLVVKLEAEGAEGDLPCIGMINPAVYKGLQEIEAWQTRNRGVPSEGDRTRNTALYPEDWLTIFLGDEKGGISYESFKMDTRFNLDGTMVPMYAVVGVWFKSLKDDPSIGADLARVWDDCSAVLF